MMTDKLLSIIIPCYNAEEFIAEAVESALNQTYPHKEVIVVDDGSTDGSLKVLSQFGNQIQVISKQNGGASTARNTGILASRGDYIMFLDGDDLMSPESAQEKIKILESRPDIGLVIGRYQILTEEGFEPGHWSESYLPVVENPFALMYFVNPVSADPIYRREVFANCGFYNPFLKSSEDSEYYLRIATKYSIAFDDNVRSYYRRFKGKDTLSRKKIDTYKYRLSYYKLAVVYAPQYLDGQSFKWQITRAVITFATPGVLSNLKELPLSQRLVAYYKISVFNPYFPIQVIAAKFWSLLKGRSNVQNRKDERKIDLEFSEESQLGALEKTNFK
jgi:glycosyltransferase involved in cell wall biosynthesis